MTADLKIKMIVGTDNDILIIHDNLNNKRIIKGFDIDGNLVFEKLFNSEQCIIKKDRNSIIKIRI